MICATHVHAAVLEATPEATPEAHPLEAAAPEPHPLDGAAPQAAEEEPVTAATVELNEVSVSRMLLVNILEFYLTCKRCWWRS